MGDGCHTHAWEDDWLSCGPLSSFVSYRFIHASGYTVDYTVHDFLSSNNGAWPITWVEHYPHLSEIVLPNLSSSRDVINWNESSNKFVNFSVSTAYVSLDDPHELVSWYKSV